MSPTSSSTVKLVRIVQVHVGHRERPRVDPKLGSNLKAESERESERLGIGFVCQYTVYL